ncbi:hypothetical protein BJX96DRAFT_153267 [Aspergillus floccosus]
MTGAGAVDDRPTWTTGELALPNNLIFPRILVTESSLHFAAWATYDVVSLFLLYTIRTIMLRCQESRFPALL